MSEIKNSGKQQKLKISQFLKDIESGNDAKVNSGLKGLEANGDPSVLPALVNLLKTDLSEKTKEEILEFFRGLKDSNSIPVMIGILNNDDFIEQRQSVLSTIWNTKLDYAAYIADFVGIATEGNFMEALECLTILENLDGPFEERHILESQLFLKEYLEDESPKDPQKAKLISEIALLLQDWDRGIDAEG